MIKQFPKMTKTEMRSATPAIVNQRPGLAIDFGTRLRQMLAISLLVFGGLLWQRVDFWPVALLATRWMEIGEKLPWYLSRSSGAIAYLALTASVVWGLLLSTRLVRDRVPAPITLAMHNDLGWIAIGLTLFHALSLLFDSYFTYKIWDLLIPFVGPYEPFWTGIGTLALYLMILTAASFHLRRWIGQARWRALHYLTFLVFVMATVHGWMAGTDSATLGILYKGSGALVLFLTLYRVIDALGAAKARRPAKDRGAAGKRNVTVAPEARGKLTSGTNTSLV